jgi:superfamily II DNA helicase RecQ
LDSLSSNDCEILFEEEGEDNSFSIILNPPVPKISESLLDKLNTINSDTFHLSSFRGVQIQAIPSTLENKYVFVLMPTGGGKSLCFQLPGIFQKGLTIVVSSLRSFMYDQIESLKEMNIEARELTSNTTKEEYNSIISSIEKIRYIYV